MLPSSNSNNLLSFRDLWKGLVPSKIERRVSPNGLIPRFLDLKSPDPPLLKWNIDASVPSSSGCADIGGVLGDAKGIVLGMFSVLIGVKESNEEELIVVIKVLEVSSSSSNLTGHSFIIEYDSHGCSIGLLDHGATSTCLAWRLDSPPP
ncbi:hypothetical protein Peur_002397 [Populus x canadensis]